jgi:hypothetical protein
MMPSIDNNNSMFIMRSKEKFKNLQKSMTIIPNQYLLSTYKQTDADRLFVIDFYKSLSKLLTDTRENFITKSQAEKRLEELLEDAIKNKLDVKIDPNILDSTNLMRLDDEKSFRSEDDDYGFESDSDSSYSY